MDRTKREFERWEILFAAVVFLAGLSLRLWLAVTRYLNPDEAQYALWAEGSLRDTLRNSMMDWHPPLISVITHAALLTGRSELTVRLVPVLAGSLFPVLLAFWLWKVAGKFAAMTALLLLTLGPNLIAISAQVRSYTVALFFLSASLAVLEEALDRDQWQLMAAYSLLLWPCILSDYGMAWFVGAAGFYCLLRLKGASRAVKATWAAGQLAAATLYGLLFLLQIRNSRGEAIDRGVLVVGYLRNAFPKPGGMLRFPFVNTVKAFAYLMGSQPAGLLALAMFAVAVFCLLTGRTGIVLSKARALAVLILAPFLLNLLGAYAHVFPYGGIRQTFVIGLFCACGVAIFVQTLPRRAAIAVLCGWLLLSPVWYAKADPDPQNIRADLNQRASMVECLDYMHRTIPPNALIFTTQQTLFELAYYESHKGVPLEFVRGQLAESSLGPWRAVIRDYGYSSAVGYEAAVQAFRRQYGLAPAQPVWGLLGGWTPTSRLRALVPGIRIDDNLPFTRAVLAFQDDSH